LTVRPVLADVVAANAVEEDDELEQGALR